MGSSLNNRESEIFKRKREVKGAYLLSGEDRDRRGEGKES